MNFVKLIRIMIFWIASYPKSGNTWVRAFLTNYLSNNPRNVFEKINKINRFPSKDYFKSIVDTEALKKDNIELFKYFITAQEKINKNKKINIIKTHNFAGSVRGYPFSNSNNTCGSIYIVRDPRSVVVSYAHHANISFEKSVDLLLNENRITINEKLYPEARMSWKIHVLSWLNSSWPKLLIRYEDLHLDSFKYFKNILLFLNKFVKIEIADDKIKETIDICSFKNLLDLEKKFGFQEKRGVVNFFRKGEIDEWKNTLPLNIVKKIEKNLQDEMKELDYL